MANLYFENPVLHKKGILKNRNMNVIAKRRILSRRQSSLGSTIHSNSIPESQVVDGVIYIQNSNLYNDHHSEGTFNDEPINSTDNPLGVTETQPNLNDEEDRRYWGDNELDSSNSDRAIKIQITRRMHIDGNNDKISKSKNRKKLKRTLNTVISKPRICKRRKERACSVEGSSVTTTAVPNWNFSNLPGAKCYRPQEEVSSTDSDEDIRAVRKEDWRRRRLEKLRSLLIETPYDPSESSSKEDEEVCVCCIVRRQDTIIVHENTGHLCCCYSCAKELWEQGVECPVCGLQITKIINL